MRSQQLFHIIVRAGGKKGGFGKRLVMAIPKFFHKIERLFLKRFLPRNSIHTAEGGKPLTDQGNAPGIGKPARIVDPGSGFSCAFSHIFHNIIVGNTKIELQSFIQRIF